MIVSHKHKFIFLKTNKTAGTSIEIFLSSLCGPDDIITPISANDEVTRQQLGYRGPQNYLEAVDGSKTCTTKRKPIYYNHMTAREARSLLGSETWNRYFKFCFERNPWDRVISAYYHALATGFEETLSQFIRSEKIMTLRERGIGLYTIDNQIVVDKVGRYERIEEDLTNILNMIGIDEKVDLPRAKSGFRQDLRNYREILSEEDADVICETFDDEIKLFNYTF